MTRVSAKRDHRSFIPALSSLVGCSIAIAILDQLLLGSFRGRIYLAGFIAAKTWEIHLELVLAFPHSYEIKELPELPGTGRFDIPVLYFPRPKNKRARRFVAKDTDYK